MDWDANGDVMVTSSQDKAVYLYTVNKAGVTNILQSKKHGVSAVRFTSEGPRHIVCSSCAEAPAASGSVCYIHFVDNSGRRVLRGRGISPHPSRDLMLVSTSDNVCSLYTYDSSSPVISYNASEVIGVFDSMGTIFALYQSKTSGKSLYLYDIAKYQTPFSTFDITEILFSLEEVVSLDFNPNGKLLILGTDHRRLICINAMDGSFVFLCSYTDEDLHKVDCSDICYPSISPDSKYLLCGCSNGDISIWDFEGRNICRFAGHEGPPYFTCFNPKKALVSSACVKVAWWQPQLLHEKEEC
ncbi:wd40 repeat protein swd2 [Babesia gibsoni]|uniref:Wd40 repeat protein swd2 n=1 Tax=Babesia gibsoni TaxID=33632 RepID=A0AAD8LIX8_BABGI|nr:wd40 repeat protein swd2 [Babesia gibsoni]